MMVFSSSVPNEEPNTMNSLFSKCRRVQYVVDYCSTVVYVAILNCIRRNSCCELTWVLLAASVSLAVELGERVDSAEGR